MIDIETDGLDYSVIHCLVTLDVDNNIVKTFLSSDGVQEYFNNFDKIVAHLSLIHISEPTRPY